ncbi:DNA polymerase theta [Corchorus olitorius]|uniref:DNA polymerase theta n=1 Tax=Corchorus olitorius TaxID=93759 RepID=A0A1R3KP83_9ROSI|nr:DNA polymerase theta [Corchorus olitorius]
MAGLVPDNGHAFPPIPMTSLQQIPTQVPVQSAPQQMRPIPSTRASSSRDSPQNTRTNCLAILTGTAARAS